MPGFVVAEKNYKIKLEIHKSQTQSVLFNPIALKKAKIAYNFGLSERKRVKGSRGRVTVSSSIIMIIIKTISVSNTGNNSIKASKLHKGRKKQKILKAHVLNLNLLSSANL